MFDDKDSAIRIGTEWKSFYKDWNDDLKKLLKSLKDKKIIFKTYTPSFNDGDPCTTSLELLSGPVFLDIDSGYAYKAVSNSATFIAARVFQLRDYLSRESILLSCDVISLDDFIANGWINNNQLKAINEYEISSMNYEKSSYDESFRNDYTNKLYILRKSFDFSEEIENFLRINILNIISDKNNNFGFIYLDEDDKIKIQSEWIDSY